ncbi:Uncharacterised protein [Halioglobus japonicus]|nr:Uncharacterised protein [Halioglobus japonicus]
MEPALKLAIVSCGMFFLTGLLTGLWKYICIARSDTAQAPVYVDVCHRASLMYSFACLVLAKFVELSVWSAVVNFWATLAPIVFFAAAVFAYALHGYLRDTDNQLQKPHVLGHSTIANAQMMVFMWMLAAAEIGGFVVLLAGAVKGVFEF